MDLDHAFALAFDPSRLLLAQGLAPDPWQHNLLHAHERQLLLNCSRQSGKSTVVAALALHNALFTPTGLVLLLSPSLRQSTEIFRKVRRGWQALGQPLFRRPANQSSLELANGTRIVCLPGREETIRSFGGVSLLVIDEAARVPDDLYRGVRPMLAASQGRLVALSTPFGQRGWFFEEWTGNGPWKKVQITWKDCPRITADFIAEEMRALGPGWVDQEYNALFTALEGLVYPNFDMAVVEAWPEPSGRFVGGVDFGWHNPFAALAGFLDRDDMLWIGWERYARETPLHEHAAALKQHKSTLWYADPSGRTEIEELRAAGLKVIPGINDIRAGIAAVTARIRTGRLRIRRDACPNLRAEARLYRYPNAAERARIGENPVDDNNHALAALRYLVSRIDAHALGRHGASTKPTSAAHPPNDDHLWTQM